MLSEKPLYTAKEHFSLSNNSSIFYICTSLLILNQGQQGCISQQSVETLCLPCCLNIYDLSSVTV